MRLIDADRLLSDAMKTKYYHLPNGDVAIPLIDVEHAPTVGEWISVKDRLPEPGSPALVYGSAGAMTVARYTAGNIWLVPGIFSVVTHWMPLPKAPKEEKQE